MTIPSQVTRTSMSILERAGASTESFPVYARPIGLNTGTSTSPVRPIGDGDHAGEAMVLDHRAMHLAALRRRNPHGMFAAMRLRPILLCIALTACGRVASAPTPATSYPTSYETIITGGKIVDGTGNAWMYGDVGI